MYTEILKMKKYCIGCGEQIHPKRVEILPTTKTCVECSTTGAKKGITILKGDVNKDDTWVETLFVEEEEYNSYNRLRYQKPTLEKEEE
jgi:hypothetical protein|tara:strand:- start:752 stop:1015 length:264 start_codon:yes stop_codon:yes gene_type:complete